MQQSPLLKKRQAEQYGMQWISRSLYHAQQKYHLRYQKEFLSKLKLKSGMHILECGSGDGSIKKRLAELYSDIPIDYYCLDVSITLLKYIETAPCQIDHFNMNKLNATVESIPMKSNTMDIVFALSVLWYVPDVYVSIDEMYRVLKPGGQLCFDVLSVMNITGAIGKITNLISSKLRDSYRMNYVIPQKIASYLAMKNIPFTMVGYLPFLPTTLPLIGDKCNLFQYFNWLPAISSTHLQNFCNKVVFLIEK